jgi:murein DD-endopeptidase MepM/ murein hydrolase activator NlpD
MKVALAVYLTVVHLFLIGLLFDRYVVQNDLAGNWIRETALPVVPQPSPDQTETPTPTPSFNDAVTPAEQSPTPRPTLPPNFTPPGHLVVPVQGVTPDKLTDSFSDARSEGRVHDAIDIMAPLGTPVLATADGEIVKFHDSAAGGITIYQISTDKKYFFYYAHLQSRAAGVSEKQFVRQGTIIGYVGDTGNAGAGNYHLHFAISAVQDPKRFWDGISINPYNVLRDRAELR